MQLVFRLLVLVWMFFLLTPWLTENSFRDNVGESLQFVVVAMLPWTALSFFGILVGAFISGNIKVAIAKFEGVFLSGLLVLTVAVLLPHIYMSYQLRSLKQEFREQALSAKTLHELRGLSFDHTLMKRDRALKGKGFCLNPVLWSASRMQVGTGPTEVRTGSLYLIDWFGMVDSLFPERPVY